MRLAIWITALSLLAAAGARAEGQEGNCTGGGAGGLAGVVGLAITDGSGTIDSIQQSVVPYVFDAAECACPNQDLQLDIFLTSALPAGTVGTAELWMGTNCDTNSTARTTAGETQCEKVATLDFAKFVVGGSSAHLYVPISTLPLFSPVTHQCPTVNQSNGIYVLIFSGANSSPSGVPFAECSLSLEETVLGPDAPAGVTATPDKDAVVLTWSPADLNAAPPAYYQVLCDDGSDQPVAASPAPAVYSACTAGGIQRRPLPTGGSLSLPEPATLASLDKAFVCSPAIAPGSGPSSIRLDGLTAGKSYRFVVLAVDAAGNATPSAEITASPLAPKSSGGCSYAPGGDSTDALAILGILVAFAALRRRRALLA